MAKTVGDLLIKLGVDGIEGVAALKSALRGLSNASNATDKQLQVFRKEIKEIAKAGKVSQQSIRGQIDAFKGLKQQATIGSAVYKKLGKDIDSLTESLDKLNRKEEESAKKPQTAKQIFRGQGVAVVPEKFSRQIAAGNELLRQIGITSKEYGVQLAAITARTQEFTRAEQRQQVVAKNLIATKRAQTTAFLQSARVNIENTHTTAALKQKIAELAQDLEHVDIGSKEYTSTSNRLKDAQEELNAVLGISRKAYDDLASAQERSERRARKLADIQQYYGTSQTPIGEMARRAGGFRDPETGAIIARGTRAGRVSLAQQPVREISALYRSIGDVGMSGIVADIDRMGKSYQEVSGDIRSATAASNGSVRSLQAQRASWAQLQSGLDPASRAYREVAREIESVDRKLSRLSTRRGPTLKGVAQSLGGIAAGGVFGGPEGALGAIAGAPFGVGGVAAGAALGAQAKQLREVLGATADYAAEIQKLQIALDGVLRNQDEYNFALQVADQATRELNLPQADAVRGITKLSAAVKGAGGPVQDAALTFKNVSAAIKATGGSAQDVESAITAMVQVFSKGKVSAEEISGQLGERLPGAVTMFAEANNMTLTELQDGFKKGVIGLNELMNFVVRLGTTFDATAQKIGDSNAEAGARLSVAIQDMQASVGAALLPIGAQFQEAFADFVRNITPFLISALPRLGSLFLELSKNLDTLAVAAIAALGALGVAKLVAIAKGITGITSAVVVLKGAMVTLGLANPFTALALGAGALAAAIYNAGKKQKEFNNLVREGTVEQTRAEIVSKQKQLDELLTTKLKVDPTGKGLSPMQALFQEGGSEYAREQTLRKQIALLRGRLGTADYDVNQGADLPLNLLPRFKYDPLTQETPSKDISKEAADAKIAMINLRRKDLKITKAQIIEAARLQRVDAESLEPQQKRVRLAEINLREANGLKRIDEEIDRLNKKNKNTIKQQNRELEQQADLRAKANRQLQDARFALMDLSEEEKDRIDVNRQLGEFVNSNINLMSSEELAAAASQLRADLTEANRIERQDLERKAELRTQALRQLQDARFAVMNLSQEERNRIDINRQVADFVEKYVGTMSSPELATAMAQLRADLTEANSAAFKFKQGLREVFEEAMNTTEAISDLGVSAVRDLGDAFAEFVATGKANFTDLANSIIKDLARIFAQKGFYQLLGMIPGVGKFLGLGGNSPAPEAGLNIDGVAAYMNATGNAYGKNGIIPFARGGVVTRPTLFPFAKGTGLMGEAGPEAILPLSRGANGKLGVEASGGVGNVTVNVDASGSNVRGDGANAGELGKAIGMAVQAELIKQKRPGGLLA